jgi:hypothetical protein
VREVPIPEEGYLLPVASVHLEVELGLLAVVGAALLLLISFRVKGAN